MERLSNMCGANGWFGIARAPEKKGERILASVSSHLETAIMNSPIQEEGQCMKHHPGISLIRKDKAARRRLFSGEAQAKALNLSLGFPSSAGSKALRNDALSNQRYFSSSAGLFGMRDSPGSRMVITPDWPKEERIAGAALSKEVSSALADQAWEASQKFGEKFLPEFINIQKGKDPLQRLQAFAKSVDTLNVCRRDLARIELSSDTDSHGRPLAQQLVGVISENAGSPKLVTVQDDHGALVECYLVLCQGSGSMPWHWMAHGCHDDGIELTDKFIVDEPLRASEACVNTFSAYRNHRIVVNDLAPRLLENYVEAIRTADGKALAA